MLDIDDDFTLDDKVVIEGERVLGEVDHALDRVFDRHETGIDSTTLNGVKNVGHRPEGHLFSGGKVGLRSQRLLREGSERPKESDALDACARHLLQRRGSRESSGTMIQ